MAAAPSPGWKAGTQYCCVVSCHNSLRNTKGREPPVQFYRFPGKWYEGQRRQAWITAVRRVNPDGTPWIPNEASRICSAHFVGNCKSDISNHPSYVPSIFPALYKRKAPDRSRSESYVWAKKCSVNGERIASAVQEKAEERASDEPSSSEAVEPSGTTQSRQLSPQHSEDALQMCDTGMQSSDVHRSEELRSTEVEDTLSALADIGCQTEQSQTGKLVLLLSMTDGTDASTQVSHIETRDQISTTDETWKRSCGFSGFASLKENAEALQDLCGVTLPVFCLLLNLLPSSRYRRGDVSSEDKLCLFLAKLRLGITYSALAVLFNISATTASNIFTKTLDILSIALKRWVFPPPRNLMKLSLPQSFKENYPNCTFIIDCTEVRTEMPSRVQCQHLMYSNYKGGYTIKFLVGIIPNGMVAFVSKVYGGRQTDSFITQDSGFLDLLKPGDLVLSDKGFPSIRTTVEGIGAILLMPPFNVGGGQLSQEDMDKTYEVASVRIHVERVIQRLKIYHILRNKVPLSLIPLMNKIVSVCAALVNMQPPIIKK